MSIKKGRKSRTLSMELVLSRRTEMCGTVLLNGNHAGLRRRQMHETPLDLNLIFIHLVWKIADKQKSAKSEPQLWI